MERVGRFVLLDEKAEHQIRITVNAQTKELLVKCSCSVGVLLGRKRLDASDAIAAWRGHVERLRPEVTPTSRGGGPAS